MMSDIKLSENFWLSEFERSETAARKDIDNSAPLAVIDNLVILCEEILQPIRDSLGPVHITSGYRSPALNAEIGGSDDSQHTKGQAADFVVTGHSVTQVAIWIRANIPRYDQLIHEFGQWVHASTAKEARRQVLTALRVDGRTEYRPGLPA